MTRIFINYRTDDSGYAAALVYERLRTVFGADTVFRDSRSLRAGTDVPTEIWQRLAESAVLLVLIGPHWTTLTDETGVRLDRLDDYVRMEIRGGFRYGLTVIPVLVDGAAMPSASELPEDLRPLCDLQAVDLRSRRDEQDLGYLVSELARLVPGGLPAPGGTPDTRPVTVFQHGGIQFSDRTTILGDVVSGDRNVTGGAR